MSRLGKLLRAAAVAALTTVAAAPVAAQSPANQTADSLPDVFEYLEHNQVSPASFGRAARVTLFIHLILFAIGIVIFGVVLVLGVGMGGLR